GLICSFCPSGRDFAAGFLQIPPHSGHPCLWLTLPTAERVRDFHPRVIAHAGRTKKPRLRNATRATNKIRHRPTLTPVTAIPSALTGLTSLFGMGRGGHRRYRHLNTFMTIIRRKQSEKGEKATASLREKALGLLVPLSCDVSTSIPAAYQPRSLRGPSMEYSSRGRFRT